MKLFATGFIDIGGKFTASIVDVVGICHSYQRHQRFKWQIYSWCHWYQWCSWTCEYPANFRKNSKWPYYYVWGKIIHFKKPKAKNISWHCLFKVRHKKVAYLSGRRCLRLLIHNKFIVLCLLGVLLLGLEVSLLTSRLYINNRTDTDTEVGAPIYCAVPVWSSPSPLGHRTGTDTNTVTEYRSSSILRYIIVLSLCFSILFCFIFIQITFPSIFVDVLFWYFLFFSVISCSTVISLSLVS